MNNLINVQVKRINGNLVTTSNRVAEELGKGVLNDFNS